MLTFKINYKIIAFNNDGTTQHVSRSDSNETHEEIIGPDDIDFTLVGFDDNTLTEGNSEVHPKVSQWLADTGISEEERAGREEAFRRIATARNRDSFYLDLCGLQLSSIIPELFIDLPGLTMLDLNENKLTVLQPNVFKELSGLSSLCLSSNQLTTIEPGVFDKLTNLNQLDFSSNQLSTIEPGVFDKLTNLIYLNLSSNQLSTIEPEMFDKLTNLEQLHLNSNQLLTIEPGVFDNLTKLAVLDLNSNQLSTIEPGVLDRLTNLVFLNFSNNEILSLNPQALFSNLSEECSILLFSNPFNKRTHGMLENYINSSNQHFSYSPQLEMA